MTDFVIKKLPYDLSSHAGLALIGKHLKRIKINALIDPAFPVRSGIANSAIIKSYVGLLCLGKNDFDAVENFRSNAFFMRALGLDSVPSSPTLRQRLDTHAASWFDLAAELNQKLLSSTVNGKPIDFGALACGYTPVDLDTFAMDNSATKKELVGRTYAGVDGYCPFAVYLGSLGYCLELALRPGVQHSASESEYNFERALPMAASLVSTPLLVRADSGFCSLKLMQEISTQAKTMSREIAFIIKWNPRRAPVETIAAARKADTGTQWVMHRTGKRECVWQEHLDLVKVGNQTNPARRVYRLTERTLDKHGNPLLLPAYMLEGWTTTLPARLDPADIIALYCEHATHEQFHSEFKTDMDLERLPSGKFDTNYLVCQLAAVAMNLLRIIGQNTLNEPNAPVRHVAKRRRIKTVMQEMMFKAARMIKHAGRWILGLGQSDSGFAVFERHYRQLRPT
ncbi:Transposase DDE domain group 1 [Loktanella salsilacus]|uniref:Transposase DDE domain group 1 n=1 Tax=Loktanella salsilacus TaxID=195913 RepID=A0A1I4EY86_9RHOB|nr:IS1380 family transposase [Loktanella salsilacus]SFL09496.1 Transposase DDE domain group 1 [Loktanella salsilacus]